MDYTLGLFLFLSLIRYACKPDPKPTLIIDQAAEEALEKARMDSLQLVTMQFYLDSLGKAMITQPEPL